MLFLPPHTAAEIARATMRRELGLVEDHVPDDSRNAFVAFVSAIVRWTRSTMKLTSEESGTFRPEMVDASAQAVNTATIIIFPKPDCLDAANECAA